MDGAAKRRAIDSRLQDWGASAVVLDGPSFDDAIIGLGRWGSQIVVVYDNDALTGMVAADIRGSDDQLTDEEVEDEARSHVDFNIHGSAFEGSPVFFEPIQDWWDPEWEGEPVEHYPDERTVAGPGV